ncbi:hypothetical protein Tco_0706140 [Tanacetum coccineum]|uniref:Uncharacterized protein n=1 Tax=Tanacetum coccineum TaxID=301880 RepID=A0ABQ4Y6J7_9ASTR
MHIEKNVLEAILNTLLMNDKSKDTAKARQDLKRLGIRSGLWLGQTKNGKCSKPQAAYSFSPENRKKFCQFIKGVKLPDGFGILNFYKHQSQYLPDEVAKPIIELCSFFKQICSATLMEDDMLKSSSSKCRYSMSTDVARGHGGDGGGDDRPPSHHIPTGCGGCFANRGKGTRKANLGGRKAGRLHTRQETRNLGLKKITDDKGPVPIRFEWDDKKTMMPLGGHASHWSNYLGELIREMPLYYPSWQKVPGGAGRGARGPNIGQTQFDLTPHMQSQHWADINAGIQQHLQKLYNYQNASLKGSGIGLASSETRRGPVVIDTFFVTHTVNGVFIRDEDRAIYEEMVRLRALGSNTESGVPYTDEEINAMARKGKHRGHLPGVGRVLPGRARDVLIPPPPPPPQCTHNSGDECIMITYRLIRWTSNVQRYHIDSSVEQLMYNDTILTHPLNIGSGSGGCGDDEIADDEDGEEDEEDGDS